MIKSFFIIILSVFISLFAKVANIIHPPIQTAYTPATTSPITYTATTTTPTQTKTKQIAKKIVKKTVLPKSKPLPTVTQTQPTTPTPLATPPPDFAAINAAARQAVVNILCTANGDTLDPISGTGVIIDPKGVILTNAHVAEYLLLQNYRQPNFIQCIIRTGSPAYPAYHANLLYISPAWVRNNASIITSQNPTGTGENDFAFLRITGTVNGGPTGSIPYLSPHTQENIAVGEPVVLVSYPAGFLGGISIAENLSASSAVTNIQNVFTFDQNTIDVISVGGTIVSQRGSSGGAVVDGNTNILGIISTSSESPTTAERVLNAITLSYISRALQDDLGQSLSSFLAGDLIGFEQNFMTNTAPGLTKILTDQLNKQ